MSNSIIISRVTNDGKVEKKEIYKLLEEDNNKYCLLGEAIGINMEHCIALGSKHKRLFWDTVYGYKIIQNEKMERDMLKSMKKIDPEIKSCIIVRFYGRRIEEKVCFVPKRLQIPNHSELSNFPINIVFSTQCVVSNNACVTESAEYVPDFSSFIEKRAIQKMKYYNYLSSKRRYWVEIVYNTAHQSYTGTKYCDDQNIGMAFGKNWDMFFTHLTMLGVGSDINNIKQ